VRSFDGKLRFLDLAVAENLEVRDFNNLEYRKNLTQQRRYVSPIGTLVQPNEFFNCAINLLSRQENPLLKYLAENPLDLIVVFTELPLEQSSAQPVSVPVLAGNRWVYDVPALPAHILSSDSVKSNEQRPVASYAMQNVNDVAGLVRQTLLVSSQLYNQLPLRDRCGVQVHELLRYLANFGSHGKNKTLSLLSRPLSTIEIEHMTVKIINQQKIHFDEIPATTLLKAFALVGVNDLIASSGEQRREIQKMMMDFGFLTDNEVSPSDLKKSGLLTTLILYQMGLNARQSVELAEEGILEIAKSDRHTHGARWIKANRKKLKSRTVDLFELF
jgi:hypothetical protein